MKKSLLLLLLPLLCAALPALPLQVTVLDKELGLPLEGVKLSLAGQTALTDSQGRATIEANLPTEGSTLTAQFPGYEPARARLKAGDTAVTLNLALAGVLEGKELVVEKARSQKTDAQAGVSTVAGRDEIRRTAEIGIVEDVMSTIKVLPGVGYSGGWNAMPSIRGGDPQETTAVLDGTTILYPYHWGGAFSIFNPEMVESAKLSNGLISARYGQVLSGLLEVNSKTPKNVQPQINFSQSTTGMDLFVQAPLGDRAGLLGGGKITWMEVTFTLAGAASQFRQVPYIRDGYSKLFWKPNDRLDLWANFFIGSDGVGTISDTKDTSQSLKTHATFDWTNQSLVASGGLKWLINDLNLLTLSGAWNRVTNSLNLKNVTNGTKAYSPAFLADPANQALIAAVNPGATGFTLTDVSDDIHTNAAVETWQGRLNHDFLLAPGHTLTLGGDALLTNLSDYEDVHLWADSFANGLPVFKPITALIDVNGNHALSSAGYGLYDFNFGEGFLTGEAGLRLDHTLLYNADLSLNTKPVLNPRGRVSLTPWKNLGLIDSLSLTGGTGFYSQLPLQGGLFEKKYNLSADTLEPTRAWFNLLGVELQAQDGWKFSVEGYHKSYSNRMYIAIDDRNPAAAYAPHMDGVGEAWGVDVLLQKKTSRYWDGWLTYSYVDSRYLNPAQPFYAGNTAIFPRGQPLGQWFYPSYQRFHNLNLILSYKPVEGFAITTKASVATGAPKAALGPVTTYGTTSNGQVVQRYAQTSTYDDTLRNDISCPVDLKLTWSGYYPGTKVRWEYYFGVENLFANFYTPKTNKALDAFNGGDMTGSGQAEFTIGSPIPSFGYKLSY